MDKPGRPPSTGLSSAESILEQHRELHRTLDELDEAFSVGGSAGGRT